MTAPTEAGAGVVSNPATSDIAFATANPLERGLESIGWQLLSVEIDLGAETARIELAQGDLRVMLDARNGRATITRELMETAKRRVGRKGDITIVSRISPRFLSRQNCGGLRSGLRTLAHYVADNAPHALGHAEARDLFRPLLCAPAGAQP